MYNINISSYQYILNLFGTIAIAFVLLPSCTNSIKSSSSGTKYSNKEKLTQSSQCIAKDLIGPVDQSQNMECKFNYQQSAKSPIRSSGFNGSCKTDLLGIRSFGKVQGVFFRKYTQNTGKSLGLRGWCENTQRGTVVGALEGPSDKINTMKEWLSKTGSPKSRIERVEFRNEKSIREYTFSGFNILRK